MALDTTGIVPHACLNDPRRMSVSHAARNNDNLQVAVWLLRHRRATITNRFVHLDFTALNRVTSRVAPSTATNLRYGGGHATEPLNRCEK